MEAIGIDTIKLNLNDYEVEQDNGLIIQPSAYNNKTKDMTGDFQLWEGQRGSKAFWNYEDGMTVNIKPKGSQPFCFVQYSFGRVANRDNFYPVELETMKATLTNTENRLRDLGIHTNIFNASLSRVDPFRNVLLDEKPQSYFKTLQLCEGKRMQKRDYGTTVNWINTVQEISMYDKLVEMTVNKKDTSGFPENVLRIEQRLKKGSKIKDLLGFGTVGELIKPENFRHVQEKYILTLETNVFRYNGGNIEQFSQRDLEQELRVFQNVYGNRFLSAFIKAKGFESIIQRADPEVFLNAIRNVDLAKGEAKKKKVGRYKREFDKMKMDLELIKTDLFTGRSNAELYNELRAKALSLVA